MDEQAEPTESAKFEVWVDAVEAAWNAWKVRAALATKGSEGAPAAGDVLRERERQKTAEGWTPEHDDEHGDNSMAVAAACYALAEVRGARVQDIDLERLWQWTGWSRQWFKPKDKRRNLVRAGALIIAEIERLDRAAIPPPTAPGPVADARSDESKEGPGGAPMVEAKG